MAHTPFFTDLASRAVIAVEGQDWRGFLQGLITQDVETLAVGEVRFAALLSPQGRVLFDLFVMGVEEGCLIDCAAERRAALIQRLMIYRLRAKVTIAPSTARVSALWETADAPAPWARDPRLPELGYRGLDAAPPADARRMTENDWRAHCLRLGVPGPADWGDDKTYPIEANFDLLNGIDFRKGCFVGQETTSRMKRRGAVKSRMMAVAFDGEAPAAGTELLAGTLRAGGVLSGVGNMATALLRLDRLDSGICTVAAGGGGWRPVTPKWWPERPSGA